MRIAVFADIHGNLTALEAVLAEIENLAADQLICLGDVAATGPQPRQVIERLMLLKCAWVMGNADDGLLHPPAENTTIFEEIDQWCAAQLDAQHLDFLRTFQPTIKVDDLLCFHGSPRSFNETITTTTPDEILAPMLADFESTLMIGGHTHQPMLRRYRHITLINPGSVGLPYILTAPDRAYNPAWAEYALLTWEAKIFTVELRRVEIDTKQVINAILTSGMPHAAKLAQDWRSGLSGC